MDSIITSKIDLIEALDHDFLQLQTNKPDIPWYYTFYMPNDDVVSKEEMKFTGPLDERRKEVHDYHF